MSTFEESILEERHDRSKSPDLKVEKAVIQAAEKRLTAMVLIGLIGALLGVFGHHWFLFIINGQRAEAQFWIKTASNAFSQIVTLFMGIVAASSLTQSIWRALIKEYTQISVIDNLFSLPSPLSILGIGIQRKRQFILPLILSLVIQSLVAVSILAPNSLTVSVGHWVNITSSIPVIDFFTQIPNMYASGQGTGEPWIDQTMGTPLELYWEPPAGCESSCRIQIQYQAPALSCRKLRDDELRLSPYNGTSHRWIYYEASYSPSSSKWGNPYPGFWINYVPHQAEISDNRTVLAINQTAPISGIQCSFKDANNQATFELADGVTLVTASVKSYNDGPVEGCSWTDLQVVPSRCGNYSSNANTIQALFVWLIVWTGDYEYDGQWTYDGLLFSPTINKYIHEDENYPNHSVGITVPDLARTFEELYSNVTLAAMLSTGDTRLGWILTSDGQNVWIYSQSTLWIIYGIALGFILAVALSNLSLVANHNVGMNIEFASILTFTRNKSLDKICASDSDTIIEAKLRFSADRLRFDTQESSLVYQKLLENQNETYTSMSIPIESENLDSSNNIVTQKVNRVHPDKLALIIMIAAYFMAILFSIGHHIFLWKINKSLVSSYSQFWVKNVSNGLAHAVSLCLGLVATYSLTQTIWRTVEAGATSLAVINRLFSLPATEAYFRLLISSWRPDWVPATLVVLTTYMLLLVTIFAPNALTVGTSPERTIQVTIQSIVRLLGLRVWGLAIFCLVNYGLYHRHVKPFASSNLNTKLQGSYALTTALNSILCPLWMGIDGALPYQIIQGNLITGT